MADDQKYEKNVRLKRSKPRAERRPYTTCRRKPVEKLLARIKFVERPERVMQDLESRPRRSPNSHGLRPNALSPAETLRGLNVIGEVN